MAVLDYVGPTPADLESTRAYYEFLKDGVCCADGENGPSEYDYLPTYKELWKQASSEVRGQRNGTAYEYLNHLGF